MNRLTRRSAVAAALGIPALLAARPIAHVVWAGFRESGELPDVPFGYAEDASRLSRVKVRELLYMGSRAPIDEARKALAVARSLNAPLAIAGARHTMGGHTSFPNGLVLDVNACSHMELDGSTGILRVQAGARWDQVIAYLNERGRSVSIMQSNSSFSIGGSLGANVHGWQHDKAPFASSVEAFRAVLADGTELRCSRSENSELFSLVIGGYGLFAIVVDVDLRTVPNDVYRVQQVECGAEEYASTFAQYVSGKAELGLAYGRLSVAPEAFLTRAILTYFERQRDATPGPLGATGLPQLKRSVFRGSVQSAYGKELRWKLERLLGSEAGTEASRNQILNEPVALFQNRRADRTDILMEYFVPPSAFAAFVATARELLRKHQGLDLLNITIRNVLADSDTFLRYADQPLFSLVMLFNIGCTQAEDAALAKLTQTLVDVALANGGRHYLPYRLHATRSQFERAYPRAAEWLQKKRHYDRNLLLRNHLYLKYA